MTANYYQKHQEKLREEARERYQNLSEEEKTKGEKRPEKNIKHLRKKKKKKSFSIIVNVIKIFLMNEKKKLVEYKRNYYVTHSK